MDGDWGPLVSLVVASTAIMGSPGPATVSATAMGAAYGVHGALRYVGGLMAGTAGVLGLVAFGLAALVLALPQAGRPLLWLAAGYILFLSWRIATAPPLTRAERSAGQPSFAAGFLLAIANPKAWLAIAAVYAGGAALAAWARLAVLAAMIVLIHLAWLLAGATLAGLLHHPVAARIVNLALAATLVATTAMMLMG
jgi:threonine/homoserine/homoserine lactone efflux protein